MDAAAAEEHSAGPWETPEELATRLRIPVQTVYAWRSRGGGPPGYKIGRHVRFNRREVTAWMQTRRSALAQEVRPPS
jgi:excisionase family DNA binding protein